MPVDLAAGIVRKRYIINLWISQNTRLYPKIKCQLREKVFERLFKQQKHTNESPSAFLCLNMLNTLQVYQNHKAGHTAIDFP